jgi:hypothetical protein
MSNWKPRQNVKCCSAKEEVRDLGKVALSDSVY